MFFWLPIATLVAGGLLGATLVWLSLRGVAARASAEARAKNTVLQASLEQRAEALDKYEAELQHERQRQRDMQATLAELKASLTEIRVRRQEENRAAQEKMALLQNAEQQLSEAFKALSADALKSNNQAFIDLAQATLERFQTGHRQPG